MRFNILEDVNNLSGYSQSTRDLGKALSKHIEVVYKQPYQDGDLVYGRPVFQNLIPLYQKNIPIIGQITLESTVLHERFVREANLDTVKQVWCPSTFCKDNYTLSGVIEDKIKVVPHGVDSDIFKPVNVTQDGYTFMFVGGFTGMGDRKGADLLVNAFEAQFSKQKDAKLYLKINTAYGNTSAINDLLKLAKSSKDRITVDTVSYSDEDLNKIYNLGDCFVSPTRSEGFNMTCLEAMAAGLPLVTTEFGGQRDFVPDDNLYLMDFRFRPARYTPWDCGYWVEPTIENIKGSMQYAFDNQDEMRKVGRKNVIEARKWSWQKASLIALEHLKTIS